VSWNVSKETWDEGAKRTDTRAHQPRNHIRRVPGDYFNARQKPSRCHAEHVRSPGPNRQGLIEAFKTQEQIGPLRGCRTAASSRHRAIRLRRCRATGRTKTQDIADARKLLADAGYGSGMPAVELAVRISATTCRDHVAGIQDQLQECSAWRSTFASRRSLLVETKRRVRFTLVLDTPGGPIPTFPAGEHILQNGRLTELRRLQQAHSTHC